MFMDSSHLHRLRNEVTSFLKTKNNIIPDCDPIKSPEDVESFIMTICTRLTSINMRLTLLDTLIRRKSDIFLPYVNSLDFVIQLLISDFSALTKDFGTEKLSVMMDLCLCAQLLSFCLSKSTGNLENQLCGLYDPLKSVLQGFTVVDCLTACSTLLIALIQCRSRDVCTQLFTTYLRGLPFTEPLLAASPYCVLAKELLLDIEQPVSQLALIHSFLGLSPAELWSSSLHEDHMLAGLTLEFCFERKPGSRAYNALEMPVLLFLSKIGQILSSRSKICCALCETRVGKLFNFFLEIKGCPVAVIRHACLDICTNVLITHFAHCSPCSTNKEFPSCVGLSTLISAIASSPWSSPGTLALLSRSISTILERTGYHAQWILNCLLPVSYQDSAIPDPGLPTTVASKLLRCASDQSLGLYVSDIYVQIALKLSSENTELLQEWFGCLVQISVEEYTQYSALINQYLLPKLTAANPRFIVQLLEYPLPNGQSMALPLMLACYRVLLRPESPAQFKKQAELMAPEHKVMLAALTACDAQIRLSAFELLLALVKSSNHPDALLSHAELFLHFLKHNMWTFERSVRNQIVAGMSLIVRRLMDTRRKQLANNSPSGADRFFIVFCRLGAILLRSLYPGVPAPRMNLALSALYTLVTILPSPEASSEDVAPHPTGFAILLQATRMSQQPSIPSSEPSTTNMIDMSENDEEQAVWAQRLLARLFLGLCSPHEEDREQALQTILCTNLARHLVDDKRSYLWFQSMTILAESAKPDISPLAWNILRLTVNNSPFLTTDRCSHGSPNPSEITLMGLRHPSERACYTIRYLLLTVEQTIRLVEGSPVQGLLAMAAKTPFYAMLSAIRALLSQFDECPISKEKRGCSEVCAAVGQKKRVPLRRTDRPLSTSCIFDRPQSATTTTEPTLSVADRLIAVALRISDLILPILAHAAPEGHIPNDDVETPFELLDTLSDHVDQTKQYPEYLTICCWRSVRELSVLLGCCLPRTGVHLMTEQMRSAAPGPLTALGLSQSQILQISEFFCAQLICGRHGGAIEQCSVGFAPFCRALLSSGDNTVKQFPVLWLDTVLNNLLNNVTPPPGELSPGASLINQARWLPIICLERLGKGYCVTRRSAGLPLFIQDILGASWIVNGKDGSLTISTVNRLLTVIEHTFNHCLGLKRSDELSNCWPWALQRCVVVLNIVRTLLRSSTLMQPTAEFTERAICLAINGLGCADWALRNSSGLLFSTLIERLFGVNRSREVTSRKNCLSSANFFKRYPNLKNHIVRTLKDTTSDLNLPNLRRTRLYASLLILTRLLPPTQQAALSGLVEQTFGPYVLRCAISTDIRIRQLAARALLSLVPANRLPQVTLRYIQELEYLVHPVHVIQADSNKPSTFSRTNLIHGLLLQLHQLLSAENWIAEERASGSNISQPVCTRSDLLTRLSTSLRCLVDPRLNPCPVVRKTALDILGSRGALIHWDRSWLLRSGLEREASDSYVRTFVQAWLIEACGRFQAHLEPNTADPVEPIMAFVIRLGPSQIRVTFLRQIYRHLTSDITEGAPEHQFDHSFTSDRIENNDQFMQFLAAHIGVTELASLVKNATPDNLGAAEIRYACCILLRLSESMQLDSSVWTIILDRGESLLSENCGHSRSQTVASLAPMLRVLVSLINPMTTVSELTRFAGLLHVSVQWCMADGTSDTSELSLAILRVLALFPTQWTATLFKITVDPIIFLLDCMLNYSQYRLQEEACATCQRLVNSTKIAIGTQQPYVILPELLVWLTTYAGFNANRFVHSVLVPLIQRISLPSPDEKDIRVFARGSEDRIFDVMHTVETLVTTLCALSVDIRTEKTQSAWTDFKSHLDDWLLDEVSRCSVDEDLLKRMILIHCDMTRRYVDFLAETWPVCSGSC